MELPSKQKETILPIKEFEDQIIQTIIHNPVTIICGETGCGKTTQVPQYIIKNIPQSKVIVTQPRRIAAISVAQRVAEEQKTRVGDLVGYHIGMDNKISNFTRISYVTTGILLQKLTNDPRFLQTYTHIVFDQVHERGIECDFSLIAIKLNLCQQVRSNLKIIVMSATLNSNLFSDFFAQRIDGSYIKATIDIQVKKKPERRGDRRRGNSSSDSQNETIHSRRELKLQPTDKPALCITLPSLRRHKIIIKYLNDVIQNPPSTGSTPNFDDFMINQAIKICIQNLSFGDILIFVPGMREIKMMANAIAAKQLQCKVFELHSQFNVSTSCLFAKYETSKIIISTNIAESSITLPDVKTVIDFCMSKQSQYSQRTNFQRLEMCWASRASMIQRAGRVGRVSDGTVYRLILQNDFKSAPEYDQPQMIRNSLEKTILRIKKLDALASQSESKIFNDVFEVLSNAFEPPDAKKINKTIQNLVFEEALIVEPQPFESHAGLKYYGAKLTISQLGKYVVEMPCDIHLAKMLILASAIGVHEQMIDIVALICYKKAFFVQFEKRVVNHQNYIHTLCDYDDGGFSDFNAKQKIFADWLNQFFFPWKRRNYHKFEIKQKNRQKQDKQTGDEEEIYYQRYKNIYLDNSKLVNSFISEKIDSKEIEWCTNRCIYSNNIRQVLSLRESIQGKVNRKLNIYYPEERYSWYIQGLLETVCIFAGFKNNLIEIQLNKRSGQKIETIKEDDVDITLLLEKTNFTQDQLEEFIFKNQKQQNTDLKIVKSGANYFVTGNIKYLAKLQLPFKTRKSAVPKGLSPILSYLIANNPIYQYIFTLQQKKSCRRVTVDDESINKAQFYSGSFQGYLLTNQFMETTAGLIARNTSWISSEHATLLLMIFSKSLKFVWNQTQQLFTSILVNETQYKLPFFMTNELLELIQNLRKQIKSLFSVDKNQKVQYDKLISSLVFLMDDCELIRKLPVVEGWEEPFAISKGFPARSYKISEQVDSLKQVPRLAENYYKQYKNWKRNVLKQLQNQLDQLRYDHIIFVCKQCLPDESSIVCNLMNVNKQKGVFIEKESTSEWIVREDKIYCRGKTGHYLGQFDSITPVINCKELLMMRYPDGKLRETSLKEINFKQLLQEEKKGKEQVLRKREEDRTYQCKICYDSGYEHHEENYSKFRSHCWKLDHREREQRFKQYI